MTNASPVPRLCVSPQELAKMLGISKSKVYQALAAGDIPSLRIGRRYVIALTAVEKMLAGGDAR
ncbi:MAG: helix-turn-helix domain-containing protein [Bacillota bacterium]|nr:helix-turn-helix domain-containing protein [Bacillota bacterium]